MVSAAEEPSGGRFRVDLTVYLHVVDAAALTGAASELVNRTEFEGDAGEPDEAARIEQLEAVQQDQAEALSFLLDPVAAGESVAGTEIGYAEVSVTASAEPKAPPPFASLFQPDPAADAWWLTPRTAALLHQELKLLSSTAAGSAVIEQAGQRGVPVARGIGGDLDGQAARQHQREGVEHVEV